MTEEKELFEKALAIVLEFEGYKTEDTGGRTVYGISENAHPQAVEKMWNMPEAEALEIAKGIYYEEYWSKLPWTGTNWDEDYNYLSTFQAYAICVFDTAVNLGVNKALDLNEKAEKTTLSYEHMMAEILWDRIEHYVNLAKRKEYRPYLRGWLKRLISLRKKVSENG